MAYATDEKKRQAYSMFVRGIPEAEIASIMNRTPNTIKGWIRDTAEDVEDKLKIIRGEDYVGLVLGRLQALREEAWANYHSSTKKTDRGRFWKAALDVEKTEVEMMMKMGFVKQAATEENINHNLEVNVTTFMNSDLNIAMLDAFSLDLISKQLGIPREQIVDMVPPDKNFQTLPTPKSQGNTTGEKEKPIPEPAIINDPDKKDD